MYGENAGDDELMHEAFLRTGEVEGVSDFLGNKVNIELLHEELPADKGFLSFPVGDGPSISTGVNPVSFTLSVSRPDCVPKMPRALRSERGYQLSVISS